MCGQYLSKGTPLWVMSTDPDFWAVPENGTYVEPHPQRGFHRVRVSTPSGGQIEIRHRSEFVLRPVNSSHPNMYRI